MRARWPPRGRTVAVLGSGLAKLYPPQNQMLAEKIADGHGAVVTEFPIDYNPDKQSFPLRNRIVAGWSQGVVVVEAPARSGALITADQATDYGRPVYAVPGPIDRPTSIRVQQAHPKWSEAGHLGRGHPRRSLVAHPTVGTESRLAPLRRRLAIALRGDEKTVYDALGLDERQFDDLVSQSGLAASIVTVSLMKLEMKRLVKQLPGRHFVRLVG